MRSAIVILTTGAVILLDSGWWLAAALVARRACSSRWPITLSIATRPTEQGGHSRYCRPTAKRTGLAVDVEVNAQQDERPQDYG